MARLEEVSEENTINMRKFYSRHPSLGGRLPAYVAKLLVKHFVTILNDNLVAESEKTSQRRARKDWSNGANGAIIAVFYGKFFIMASKEQ